jgi:hypothetical protein
LNQTAGLPEIKENSDQVKGTANKDVKIHIEGLMDNEDFQAHIDRA